MRINRWLHHVANGVVSAKSGVCKCGHSEVLAKDSLVDIKALETFNYFVGLQVNRFGGLVDVVAELVIQLDDR